MATEHNIHPAVAALVVILLVSAGTVGVAAVTKENTSSNNNNTKPVANTSAEPPVTTATPSSTTTVSSLRDGTYSAEGTYTVPGGIETIGLTVTLQDSTIQDIALEQHATAGDTARYQGRFAANYKDLVQGKKISDVRLSRVAGSSLTSRGFNDALAQIQTNAAL